MIFLVMEMEVILRLRFLIVFGNVKRMLPGIEENQDLEDNQILLPLHV